MWAPDKRVVSTKETIGRRVFKDNPYFTRQNKTHVKIDIFYETRSGEEGISFDRLGIRDKDRPDVVAFLTPLGYAAGASQRPPHPFTGWMGIRVEAIKDLQVRPDPITEEQKNPFHALLPLERFRDPIHADNLAWRLALAAEDGGWILPAEVNAEKLTQTSGRMMLYIKMVLTYPIRIVQKVLGNE